MAAVRVEGCGLNRRKYFLPHVELNRPQSMRLGAPPQSGRGFGEWKKAGVVMAGWIVGYGATERCRGLTPRWSTQCGHLGCIKRDSGAINIRLASSGGEQVGIHFLAIFSQGLKGGTLRSVLHCTGQSLGEMARK